MAGFSELFSVLARQTDQVVLGPVGFGGFMSEAATAYVQIKRMPSEEVATHRDAIEAAAVRGAGAARIYAALVLRRVDVAAADALLDRLLDSAESCSFAAGGCVVRNGTVATAAAALHDSLGTPRARALWREVREFRDATHYAEPSVASKSAWGARFGALLERRDLAIAGSVIASLAHEPPPVGLFGAILLSCVDRFAGELRLQKLCASTALVRVVNSPRERAREVAVSEIAQRWLDGMH